MTPRFRTAMTLLLVTAGLGLTACSSMPGASAIRQFQWPKTRAQVETAPNPCVDFTVSIYFAPDVSSLTRDNRAVLNNAATLAKGCKVNSVNVTGLSDPTGSSAANLALSQKRADAVRQALTAGGLSNIGFAASGSAGAVNGDGSVDPLRRRAEVAISLSHP